MARWNGNAQIFKQRLKWLEGQIWRRTGSQCCNWAYFGLVSQVGAAVGNQLGLEKVHAAKSTEPIHIFSDDQCHIELVMCHSVHSSEHKIRLPSVPFWFVPQEKISQPSWIGYTKSLSECSIVWMQSNFSWYLVVPVHCQPMAPIVWVLVVGRAQSAPLSNRGVSLCSNPFEAKSFSFCPPHQFSGMPQDLETFLRANNESSFSIVLVKESDTAWSGLAGSTSPLGIWWENRRRWEVSLARGESMSMSSGFEIWIWLAGCPRRGPAVVGVWILRWLKREGWEMRRDNLSRIVD